MCREEPDLHLGDDSYKVVVNTKGSVGEISEELKEILTYLDCEEVTGQYSRKLDDAVNAVKRNEERRLEYMRLTFRDNEMIAKGREEEKVASIKNLMDSLKLTAQQAMDALKISAADQQRYLSLL